MPLLYRDCVKSTDPVGKYLFKVSKITLEQRPNGRCSNVILLTLDMYLPTGLEVNINPLVPESTKWSHTQ